jgi:hypothetical protein
MVRASTSTRSLSLSSTPIKEAAERTPNQLVVKGARCVITLNDGKFLAVLEECDYVRPERPMSGIGPKAEVDEHALF